MVEPPNKKQKIIHTSYDEDYFVLYSTIEIHREMLEDRSRTETYRSAITSNSNFIKNKIVLDVGMGSGILSYFAACAGAKKVYGVEACLGFAKEVQKVLDHNKLSNIIQIVPGMMENVIIPEKVDVIISEWMGYMLLYESMLDSVIYARDNYLKPNGRILPSRCEIFLMPFSDLDDTQEDNDFWKNVYGLDMSPLIPFAKECESKEPEIALMPPQYQMALKPQCIKQIDCMTVKSDELNVISNFTFKSMINGCLNGFAIWFNVEFDTDDTSKVIPLKTGPEDPETHWCQTLLNFTDGIDINQDEEITGNIIMDRSKIHKRALSITISLSKPKNITKEFLFE